MNRDADYNTKLLMVAAVVKVLGDLGRQSYSLIEQHLMNIYGLSLRAIDGPGSYSLEQLREGLENLIGEQGARRILEDILLELDKLSEATDLETSKRKGHRSRSK